MSRWDDWGWYRSPPKKPPPKHGIKVKKSGSTWWGQRWIEALERMSSGYSNRLSRGRSYARAGRTHDLVVKAGQVTAKVTGSRATPYTVTINLAKLSDAVWDKAIAAMAAQAQFSAELLAGQMPQEIDAAFKKASASIFPVKSTDLTTDCSCPDYANPCKHVAAAHYVLGEALDRDPFLLFELRGRTKAQVLDALRNTRAGREGKQSPSARKAESSVSAPSEEVPGVLLAKLVPSDYDRLRGPLPAVHLKFEAPPVSGGLLRQLGRPPGWASDTSPADLLGPLIRNAADRARSLAMAEGEATADPDSKAATMKTMGRTKSKARASRRDP